VRLLEELQELRGHMEAPSIDHPEAIAAAMGVLDRHLAALIRQCSRSGPRRSTFHIIAWLEGA
jgi:hypothetical protein